ncbi:hypothetical protein [Streptomyces altiplanensis]
MQPAVLIGTLGDNTTTEFQEEEPPPPTDAQVAWAKNNIGNEMDWLNHLHDYMQDAINECYERVTEDPTYDPGEEFCANVIDDALWGIGGVPFPGNAFFSAAVANIFWGYVTDTPPNLRGVAADVWARFSESFLQAETDLAAILEDIPGNWGRTWTNPATGEVAPVWTMASPELSVPDAKSLAFQTMTTNTVTLSKVVLAKILLPQRWFVLIDPKGLFVENGDTSPSDYIESMITSNLNPDYWDAFYITWMPDTGTVYSETGITLCENFIGTGTDDYYFAGQAPADLCNWLFQDDGYGRITNPNGLATRHDVFCNWGLQNSLPQAAPNCSPYGAQAAMNGSPVTKNGPQPTRKMSAAPDLAAEHRKAARWHALFARTDRQAIERRVIERARQDPTFLRSLVRKPRETIEAFLELDIPVGVEFEVIQETPNRFRMVLPLIGAPDGKPDPGRQ